MFPDSDYRQMFSLIHQARVAVKRDFKMLHLVFRLEQHGERDVKNHINNDRTLDDRSPAGNL